MARRTKLIVDLDAKIEDKFREAEMLLQTIPGGAEKAGVLALNRAITSAQTAANKKAREVYTISKDAFRRGMKIKKARIGDLTARMRSRSTRRELIDFEIAPKEIVRGKKAFELQVAVTKAGGLKPVSGAFVERGRKDGRLHVLKRSGRGREPLHIKYGPSPTEMLSGPEVMPYIENRAKSMMLKRMDHEIGRLLDS